MSDIRYMQCPYCGHIAKTTGIGAIHCGPHKYEESNQYSPAVRMIEISDRECIGGNAEIRKP